MAIFGVLAQADKPGNYRIGKSAEGDTMLVDHLKAVFVFASREGNTKKREADFWKYVYKVQKVYPYAKRANELLKQYEPEYLSLKKQSDRRKLVKKIEDQLLDEYKDDMKKMTISEGRILIKLIDRETGRTSYSLIKDFRGGFSAVFWQSLAKIFGNDLKSEYDPAGEDRVIEEIVRMIESGEI
jgi:hypothetical protein